MEGWRGFTNYADEVLAGTRLSADDVEWLTTQFAPARERMTQFGTTATTAGSIILVLVALMVGLAKGSDEQADKLVDASDSAAQLAAGCSTTSPGAGCNKTQLAQAQRDVAHAQSRVQSTADLNRLQAIAGVLVMVGLVLGLAGILTNPVQPPATSAGGKAALEAWRSATERLKRKRNWIISSLAAQFVAIGLITVLVLQVVF